MGVNGSLRIRKGWNAFVPALYRLHRLREAGATYPDCDHKAGLYRRPPTRTIWMEGRQQTKDITGAMKRHHRLRRIAHASSVVLLKTLGLVLVLIGPAFAAAGLTAASPSEPPGKRIEITVPDRPPVSLYYEEHGEGPPVLLLHGLGESTFTWHEIVPKLAERRRVIALDLKGFGRSEKPEDGAYDASDQAALAAQFLIDKQLEDVSVVGHSFGGTVALETALAPAIQGTRRIRRVAVIGAPVLPRSTARHLDLVKMPGLPDLVAATLPPEFFARLLLSEAMGGIKDVSEETIEGYAAPYREPEALQAFLATARGIVAQEQQAGAVAKRLKRLRLPTLVVWCRKDPIVPLRAGKRLAAALPSAKLRIIDGCHHLPQHERPDALLRVLDPFLGN